jgi:hypothetical protein
LEKECEEAEIVVCATGYILSPPITQPQSRLQENLGYGSMVRFLFSGRLLN